MNNKKRLEGLEFYGQMFVLGIRGHGGHSGSPGRKYRWQESLGRSVVSRMLEKMGHSDKEAI